MTNNKAWEEDSIKVNDADGNLKFEVIDLVKPDKLVPTYVKGAEYSDWRKDLGENWTNTTTGNKVGQTFLHVPSGTTVSTAGAMGGVESIPSTISIDGDSVSAPDITQYTLQGYAKPMGSEILRKKKKDDTNKRLNASQKIAKEVNADELMNARVDDKIVSEKNVNDIIKLSKFSKELQTFFKYLFNKGPKVLDNNYFSKGHVKNLFKNGFINDKGNFAVNDFIVGSGQKLNYNPHNNTYSVKFNYDFSDNITEIINNPEKYNYKPGWNRLAMNLRLIFGGKYGLDALGLPGRAIEIAKAFGGGKAIPGEITIDAVELEQLNKNLIDQHWDNNPSEGDYSAASDGYVPPHGWAPAKNMGYDSNNDGYVSASEWIPTKAEYEAALKKGEKPKPPTQTKEPSKQTKKKSKRDALSLNTPIVKGKKKSNWRSELNGN